MGTKFKYLYIIQNSITGEIKKMHSNSIRHVGDTIYLDGVAWTIEEVQDYA